MFETVKEGTNKGQLVRLEIPASSVIRGEAPRNPYATGYGKAVPTSYRVRTVDGRWRRVYCAIYSNVGTCYVRHGKARTIVDFEGA